MIHRALARLRAIAFLEGLSYLLLLGVAMPLKYLAGMPMAVRVTGLAHGLLFIAFLIALAQVAMMLRWRGNRIIGALAAALIPFGTFVLDRRLRDDQESLTARGGERAA